MPHKKDDPPAALTLLPSSPEEKSDKKRQEIDNSGHRRRLRERFLDGPASALPDYELLELLLFSAHPRKDVKPIAKDLLKRFGGALSGVLYAKREEAEDVPGMNLSALAIFRAVREAAARILKEEIVAGALLNGWKPLVDYCRLTMGFETTEHFRVLYLNTQYKLIKDDLQETGTVDHTPVYIREVVKRAVTLDAKCVVMVHNHPGGDVTPSKADISVTQRMHAALHTVGVALVEHIIVSRSTHFSFKSNGYL
ncbi:MAG: DNA repair protein RadC [Rickettsiales bacterium]